MKVCSCKVAHPGVDLGADSFVLLQRSLHLRRAAAEVLVGQNRDHVVEPRVSQRRLKHRQQ